MGKPVGRLKTGIARVQRDDGVARERRADLGQGAARVDRGGIVRGFPRALGLQRGLSF